MGIHAVRSALTKSAGAVTRRYLVVTLIANLLWETAQLPFYTIWKTGSFRDIVFAVLHCTAGDVMIAAGALLLALLLVGHEAWPQGERVAVALATAVLGASYTVFSEWLNVSVRGSWVYAATMPVVPPFGTGLLPLLQWLIIPPLGILLIGRRMQAKC